MDAIAQRAATLPEFAAPDVIQEKVESLGLQFCSRNARAHRVRMHRPGRPTGRSYGAPPRYDRAANAQWETEHPSPYVRSSIWCTEHLVAAYVRSFDSADTVSALSVVGLSDLIGLRIAPRFSGIQNVRIANKQFAVNFSDLIIYRLTDGDRLEADPPVNCVGEKCLSIIMRTDWLLQRLRNTKMPSRSLFTSLLKGDKGHIAIPYVAPSILQRLDEVDRLCALDTGAIDLHVESSMLSAIASSVEAAIEWKSPPRRAASVEDYERLTEVRARLACGPECKIKLDELCAISGMNRTKLRASFKAAFGISMDNYKRAIRLERAAELVRTTNLTLHDIAEEVGYNDASALSVAYRRYFGHSPSHERSR